MATETNKNPDSAATVSVLLQVGTHEHAHPAAPSFPGRELHSRIRPVGHSVVGNSCIVGSLSATLARNSAWNRSYIAKSPISPFHVWAS